MTEEEKYRELELYVNKFAKEQERRTIEFILAMAHILDMPYDDVLQYVQKKATKMMEAN